jgi:hypothetical protein
MDVAAVTSFFFVRSSSRGMSSRYAAVKAPEVMTRRSSVIVFIVVLLSLKPAGDQAYDACASAALKLSRFHILCSRMMAR